ncbi:MAG: hypothetical protein GY866_42355 [Proteobacteria bacterium]|nr:hypothetical protein [Pseudomonadota bacterium]
MIQTSTIENLLARYSVEQILRAIVSSYKAIAESESLPFVRIEKVAESTVAIEPAKTSDHSPCRECGGSFFLRTGTCHVCQTCGRSQGCS